MGAGPGDPGLFTVRGKQVLAAADVVVYDRLVSAETLAWAAKEAELIYAGKEPGGHTLSQDGINRLLVQRAKQGKTVVRLKGGDPFVFGRGGEEALYLREHGCVFEVVPGVSSAVAVPAYAGIPVTHRGLASVFTVVTGHEQPGKAESSLCWKELAGRGGTLVFLMGVSNLQHITGQLQANGKPGKTPVALICSGTLPGQKTITGTLETILADAEADAVEPPAVLVVGEVARLRPMLCWAEAKPLWGKRVVVTRAAAQAAAFADRLRALGAETWELPAVDIIREPDQRALQQACAGIEDYDWIVFTSANAVDLFFTRYISLGLDVRRLHAARICTIGPATRRRLQQRGIVPDSTPAQYRAEGIIELLARQAAAGQKVLLPRARGARSALPEGLRAAGLRVDEIPLYEACRPDRVDDDLVQDILSGRADIITFTSSSTVRNFAEIVGRDRVAGIDAATAVACIGPITARTAREYGFSVDVEAATYTIDGLIAALSAWAVSGAAAGSGREGAVS